MTVTLAFYKGRGSSRWDRLVDWCIRTITRSQYSHVEIIRGVTDLGRTEKCFSSSTRDGGVRSKMINLRPESWDLVEIPSVDPNGIERYFSDKIGLGYDYTGIFLSHFLAFGIHSKRRWFCSEIVAGSIGLGRPHRLSPQLLWEVIRSASLGDPRP